MNLKNFLGEHPQTPVVASAFRTASGLKLGGATGKAQRQLWEDKEYFAHRRVATGTYPSSYINTVKEGGESLPSNCERGATAPLAPLFLRLCWEHNLMSVNLWAQKFNNGVTNWKHLLSPQPNHMPPMLHYTRCIQQVHRSNPYNTVYQPPPLINPLRTSWDFSSFQP